MKERIQWTNLSLVGCQGTILVILDFFMKGGVRFCEPTNAENAKSDEHDISVGFVRCESAYMIRLSADQHRLRFPQQVDYKGSTNGDLAVQFVGDEMEIILNAKSPGKFSEFFICTRAGDESKQFHVKANVLPKNMGTPALKDNVVCISKSSCESDVSDWKGH
jgi:hypothetical protein